MRPRKEGMAHIGIDQLVHVGNAEVCLSLFDDIEDFD
jgi:hypothetical protein